MSDSIYLAEPGDEEEVSLSRFISLLGVTPGAAATFAPAEGIPLSRAWDNWRENWFRPHLAPAFVESYLCGIASRIDEVQSIDSLLDPAMPDEMAERSRAAAKAFLEGKTEMRGNREWLRYAERIETGETPGHVAIVFALQSALFHLPLPSALSAYSWFEFRSRAGKGIPPEATEEEKMVFATILPDVGVAVSGKSDDSGDGPGTLRAI